MSTDTQRPSAEIIAFPVRSRQQAARDGPAETSAPAPKPAENYLPGTDGAWYHDAAIISAEPKRTR